MWHVDADADSANSLSRCTPDDLLIAVNCWQIYHSTLTALQSATEMGVRSVLLTDSPRPLTGVHTDDVVAVPSESVGFFPSLVGALSVVQAIVVELTALNPARSRAALANAEAQWHRFGLLRSTAR